MIEIGDNLFLSIKDNKYTIIETTHYSMIAIFIVAIIVILVMVILSILPLSLFLILIPLLIYGSLHAFFKKCEIIIDFEFKNICYSEKIFEKSIRKEKNIKFKTPLNLYIFVEELSEGNSYSLCADIDNIQTKIVYLYNFHEAASLIKILKKRLPLTIIDGGVKHKFL